MARDLRQQIEANAAELQRLHARVRETHERRGENRKARLAWDDACAEFHARYDALAFPGGYAGAPERVAAGDPQAMEAALVFLELRPYFLRSGYMYKKLMRCAQRAPFSKAQAQRFRLVLARAAEWRARRRAGAARLLSLDELYRLLERRGYKR